MKILTWNVNGRIEDAAKRQIRAVLRRDPDIICLQEVTGKPGGRRPGSYPSWTAALLARGYSVVSSVDLVALPNPEPPHESPPHRPPTRKKHGHSSRKYFNLIAAKHPLSAIAGLTYGDAEEARLGFPEKHVAGRVSIQGREIDIHCTHLPPGVSNGLVKVHHFEAVNRRVMRDRARPRILCGDFNAPVEENALEPEFDIDGGWSDPWTREEKVRWRDAEWSILKNEDMRDTYRATHRPRRRWPVSHYTGRTRRRYDHIFASPEFEIVDCRYLTGWLDRGMSDHAAVEAELRVLNPSRQ